MVSHHLGLSAAGPDGNVFPTSVLLALSGEALAPNHCRSAQLG